MLTILLLSACTPADPEAEDPTAEVADLSVPGPWNAGTRELVATGSGGDALTLQLWYPTEAEPGDGVRYDGLLDGDARENAAEACDEVRPLLAFSHGSGGLRFQSPFFTERLATHGYVVVAPDHPGNTFVDPDPDYVALLATRPRDIVDAVGAALSDEGLADCLAGVDTYAVAGHSFGGYTALALGGAEVNGPTGPVSYADPRVTAVIGMAPWDGAGAITDGSAQVAVPTLILTGERDETTPIGQVRRLYDPLPEDLRHLGVFPDAGHFSFSPIACDVLDGDGCGDGWLPLEELVDLVDTASLAFLEDARGVDGAIEQLPESPELVWED